TPGSFCVYDALTDVPTTGAITLATSMLDAIVLPEPGLVAVLLRNATLLVFGANTGVPVLNMPLPSTPGQPLKLGAEGSTLFVLYSGLAPNPFTSGTPGGLRPFSLPSGTPGITMLLPSGNPDDFIILPNSGIA